jgi:hypothetical protein
VESRAFEVTMRRPYPEKLKDPKWQKKRLEILARDEWSCRRCFDTKSTLQVHHRIYLPDAEPWEYPNKFLVTLCEECHEAEREEMAAALNDISAALKEIFFASEVRVLAEGFKGLVLKYPSEVVAEAIRYALSDEESINQITENYFHKLADDRKRRGI